MKLRFSVGRLGPASKLMNGCEGKDTPTGSIALLRSRMVTVVPPRAAKPPVPPGPMVALSAVKGGSFRVHVMVVGVTVMVPAMLNVTTIGAAGRQAQINPPKRTVVSKTL